MSDKYSSEAINTIKDIRNSHKKKLEMLLADKNADPKEIDKEAGHVASMESALK